MGCSENCLQCGRSYPVFAHNSLSASFVAQHLTFIWKRKPKQEAMHSRLCKIIHSSYHRYGKEFRFMESGHLGCFCIQFASVWNAITNKTQTKSWWCKKTLVLNRCDNRGHQTYYIYDNSSSDTSPPHMNFSIPRTCKCLTIYAGEQLITDRQASL